MDVDSRKCWPVLGVTEARRRSVTKGGYNDTLARTGSMVRGFSVVQKLIAKESKKKGLN